MVKSCHCQRENRLVSCQVSLVAALYGRPSGVSLYLATRLARMVLCTHVEEIGEITKATLVCADEIRDENGDARRGKCRPESVSFVKGVHKLDEVGDGCVTTAVVKTKIGQKKGRKIKPED